MRWIVLFVIVFSLVTCVHAATHTQFTAFSAPEDFSVENNVVSVTDDAIYQIGWYSVNGAAWQSFILQGDNYGDSADWLSGSVTTSVPSFGYGEHYVIVYSCSNPENWDCHGTWQLQVIDGGAPPEGTHYLVQGGAPLADIVIAPDAPSIVNLAADYFQSDIFDMTGATISISNNPNSSFDFHVYIGQSSHTDALGITNDGCENGGYKIVSGENFLVLLGDDELLPVLGPHMYPDSGRTHEDFYAEWDGLTDATWRNEYIDSHIRMYNDYYDIWESDGRGSMNAVHEFLYDQGMRWYVSGDIGTITPVKDSIVFTSLNELTNPDFGMRYFMLYYKNFNIIHGGVYPDDGFKDEFRWLMSLKTNHYTEFVAPPFAHGTNMVTHRDETIAAHPEYFAIDEDGLRHIPGVVAYPQPNFCYPYYTNENTLFTEQVAYVKAMFDIYNVSMVNVMPSDGFGLVSQECADREEPEKGELGRLSNYVWEYINNLAWEVYDEHPDKMILGGAYTTYLLPPDDLSQPIAPNIAIILTKWRSDNSDPETKKFYEDVTRKWYDLLPSHKIYNYDYYIHNTVGRGSQSIPYLFPHVISEDLSYLKDISQGELIEIETDYPLSNLDWDIFAANSFNTYITSRLYWDVDQDIDALLDEYCDLYYGPVSSQMQAFIEYAEDNYEDALYDGTIIETMREMLEDARMDAGNTIYRDRIDPLLSLLNSNYDGEEIFIDDCQVLTSPTSTYKLTQDVSSTGNCFIFESVGITLDCQGRTITYGTGGGYEVKGIFADVNENDLTIKNCNIVDGGAGSGKGIYISRSTLPLIEDNNITVAGSGIFLGSTTDFEIKGNRIISNPSGSPIEIQYGNEGIISDNLLIGSSGVGLNIFNASDLNILNNEILKGAQVTGSNEIIFTGNIFNNTDAFGLFLDKSNNNEFNNNNFISTTNVALFLDSSNSNNFAGSIISGGSHGIYVSGGSTSNTFENCVSIIGETPVYVAANSPDNMFISCP